ncbi:SDR family NAD(P)-dependent oxidoreductase [Bacillus sp. V5-8f]|uniref:SDR family NAD(P)-dependent oxidoreductase n=1 Tax=Bacillus sp. V5-8f TaxID=2053044 RepID=UPI0021552BF3|nr:glucose 1-dehydrogenase [Bacillus sp. V5-8f]
MTSLFNLDGKTAIVTGAGRGIGKSIAIGLAEAGANVVLCSRTQSELEEVSGEIQKMGRKTLIIPCDVTKPDQIQDVVYQTKNHFDSIDILINNAGLTIKRPAEEYTLEDWNQIIAVNLTGVFLFAQYTGREMIKQRSGRIINISSVASTTALRSSIAYCASKGGVNMLTKTLSLEWAPYGIHVNGIAPSYIETQLVKNIKEARKGFAEQVEARTPLGRMGHPNELVGASIFLASDAATYITGETIFVDGGWVAAGM